MIFVLGNAILDEDAMTERGACIRAVPKADDESRREAMRALDDSIAIDLCYEMERWIIITMRAQRGQVVVVVSRRWILYQAIACSSMFLMALERHMRRLDIDKLG